MRKGILITQLKIFEIFDKTGCDETDLKTTVVAYSKNFFSVSLILVVKITNAYSLLCMHSSRTLKKQKRLLFNGILLTGQIQIQQCDVMITHLFLIECLVIIQLFLWRHRTFVLGRSKFSSSNMLHQVQTSTFWIYPTFTSSYWFRSNQW